MPAADRGFLVGVALSSGHSRRIYRDGRADRHAYEKGGIYVRNFADHYRADFSGPLDFFLLEISHGFFDNAVDRAPDTRLRSLNCVNSGTDKVMQHLAAAVLPMLERPGAACPLFVDQLGLTMATYLLQQYGGMAAASTTQRRSLSRRDEGRAKEMLSARLAGGTSVSEVAAACSLSRSHFTRAFQETTGMTPHQWLMNHRVELARGLMANTARPLAEIAADCGFFDQSHFTRVFTRATGMPPGSWRREMSTQTRRPPN